MIPIIVANGISTPMIFGWESFLQFEFLTLVVEGLVLFVSLGDYVSFKRLLGTLIVMNLFSAIFAIPFWMMASNGW